MGRKNRKGERIEEIERKGGMKEESQKIEGEVEISIERKRIVEEVGEKHK